VFPWFREIVTGVPAREREQFSAMLAAAAGDETPPIRVLVQCQVASLPCALVATRALSRPARPRPSGPRRGR
jgi:hypothetical protein